MEKEHFVWSDSAFREYMYSRTKQQLEQMATEADALCEAFEKDHPNEPLTIDALSEYNSTKRSLVKCFDSNEVGINQNREAKKSQD